MAKTVHSPLGTASYPYLHRPDTEYDDDGVYKTKLTVPLAEAQAYMAAISAALDKAHAVESAKKDKKLKKADLPFEVNEEEGTVSFKFKVKSIGKYGDRIPAFYDATGKEVAPVPVGGGSKLRIGTTFYTWYTPTMGVGITLQPVSVQVAELVRAGGAGFGAIDGGYVGEEAGAKYDDKMEAEDDGDAPQDEPQADSKEEDDVPW